MTVQPNEDLRLAEEYVRAGRPELAIPHFQAAARDGLTGYIGYHLATAQWRVGDFAGALATLDAMGPVPIQHNPEYVPVLRAEVLAGLGRMEDAIATYAAIGDRPPTYDVFYHHAELLLELGRRDEAAAVFQKLEQANQRARREPRGKEDERYSRLQTMLTEARPTP